MSCIAETNKGVDAKQFSSDKHAILFSWKNEWLTAGAMHQYQVPARSGKMLTKDYGTDIMKLGVLSVARKPKWRWRSFLYHKCTSEFSEQDWTVNQYCHLEIMRVPKDINQAPKFGLMLGSFNTTMPCSRHAHCSEFVVKRSVVKLVHQRYSPDLTPCDFRLFPKTEDHLEVPEIFRQCRHLGTCDNHSEECYRRLSEMFWTVETMSP